MKKTLLLLVLTISASAQTKQKIKPFWVQSLLNSNKNTAVSTLYTFSTFTAPYQEITGPLLSGGFKWDEPDYTVPLGFNFQLYNDQNDTIIFSGASFATFNNPATDPLLTIASPMFEDFCDKAFNPNTDTEGDPGGGSPVSYTITGATGSRICKIQVKNAGFFGENDMNGVSVSDINFQLWLYETSNDIEFRFGNVDIQNGSINLTNPNGFLCGLAENLNVSTASNSNSDILSGVYNNPVKTTLTGVNQVVTGQIQSGRVYKFSRVNNFVTLSETFSQPEISIYPKPTSNDLFIKGNFAESNNAHIEFFDVTGACVYSTPFKNMIDLSFFSKGVYFIKILTPLSGVVFRDKIIIVR